MSKDISNNNFLTTSVTKSNIQPGLSESFDLDNSLQTSPKFLTLKNPEDYYNFDESSSSIEKTPGSKRKNFENYEDIYNDNKNNSPSKKKKNVYDGTTQITDIKFPQNQLYQRNLSDQPQTHIIANAIIGSDIDPNDWFLDYFCDEMNKHPDDWFNGDSSLAEKK